MANTDNDWTDGYVTDIGYTFGYYSEMNPLEMKFAFLRAGLVCPEVGTACELGFGQGLSINLHAAASTVKWYGTDFNPAQASFAQELAASAGAGAKLYDESFAEFTKRADLPDFDLIALHGIWSWISDQNRACIVDFVRRKLKVGGVLYISYNTLPGWAAFAPMRHLLTQHVDILGSEGRSMASRIDGALAFADQLMEQQPAYAKAAPEAAERLKQLKTLSRRYLAHEYFNRDWHPMHFANMVDWLSPAKVSYACSATLLDHVTDLHLTESQQAFLKEIPHEAFRESVRDFLTNQTFRRDYWVKGARRQEPHERGAAMGSIRVVLTKRRAEITDKLLADSGEAESNLPKYGALLDLLAGSRPLCVFDLHNELRDAMPLGDLLRCLSFLIGNGLAAPAQSEAQIEAVRPNCLRLNQRLIQRSRASNEILHLTSPVTGGGIPVGRVSQMFMVACEQGATHPEQLAHMALDMLLKRGHFVLKDGNRLESREDSLQELMRLANDFVAHEINTLASLAVF